MLILFSRLHCFVGPTVRNTWLFCCVLRDSTPRYVAPSVGRWLVGRSVDWLIAPLLGSGPKGVDDLCFDTYGGLSPSSPSTSPPQIPVSRPKFQSLGSNPSLEAQPKGPNSSLKVQILALRPRFLSWSPITSLEAEMWALRLGFRPQDWDLGLKMEFGPRDWDLRGRDGGEGGGGGGGENPPYVWKHRSSTPSGPLPCSPLNFNHNLLRLGTGTTDHLTLLRLFTFSAFLNFLSIQLLPRCPSDLLQHCSCPPARD